MFRVAFFVDDRRLGNALRSLAGVAHGTPEVLPVINVKAGRNGKLVAITRGSSADQLAAWMHERKLTSITYGAAGEFLQSIGYSSGSVSGLLTRAVKAGVLSKHGKGGKGNKATYTLRAKS